MRSLPSLLLGLLAVVALLVWASASFKATQAGLRLDLAPTERVAAVAIRGAAPARGDSGDGRWFAAMLGDLGASEGLLGAARCGAATLTSPLVALDRELVDRGGRLARDLDRLEGGDREITLLHALPVFAAVAAVAAMLLALLPGAQPGTWALRRRRLWVEARRAVRRVRSRLRPPRRDPRRSPATSGAEPRGSRGPGTRWTAERLSHTLRTSLGGDGVVVLANREPFIHERKAGGGTTLLRPASGLVTALEPVMRACSGTWVAHGSGSADRETVDAHDRVAVPPGDASYTLRRVWLSDAEERGYYQGLANEGLWPLCHVAHARPVFRASDWRQYQRVNARFADAVCDEVVGPDPIVLVQDYHFALVPRLIRERLPRATIISFWHIPWPNAERFGICPWGRELLTGLLGSNVVGFHTQLHCNNFVESVERVLEARIDRERQGVVLSGRESLVRSYPISVEWPNRSALEAPPPAECRRSVFAELGLAPDALLGVGVDRLDYTKGIEERLLAVEQLLERFPLLRGRFTFAQLAAPSRTVIEPYRALGRAVEALAARINRRFAFGTYRPIALLRSHHDTSAVFRYLRAADVCYVSSLHDGMNLVAKEFVAAREDERGVLVLSRFTGAASELTAALLVNPYDLEEASDALATALAMPEQEQAERMHALRGLVAEFNVYRWAGQMLADAASVRQHGRLSRRLSTKMARVAEAHA